ncbi:Bud-site selection protein [Melanogaster broomeanus]|nr:Bud-site selection protein [Melanogaster broomeanus]
MHGDEGHRGVKRTRPADEHHGVREVRTAVKKARTFEIQKISRKLKDARNKETGGYLITKDLEAQLDILKHINYDQVAKSALMTKLKKDKVLLANPSIQSAISVELASDPVVLGTPGTPMAKVHGRILSSKVIASQVMLTVEALRNLELGEADDYAPRKLSKKREMQSIQANNVVPTRHNDEESSREGNWEDENAEEPNVDDDGWESGTVSGDAGSATSNRDDDDDPPSKGIKKTTSQPVVLKGQSEFLPSLSVGFTRGDSDSEFSDSEARLADSTKKNRRGQRARRAIWEKKFGKNANHVKKQREIVHGLKRPLLGSDTADRGSLGKDFSPRSRRHPLQSRPAGHGHERPHKPQSQSQRGFQSAQRTNLRSSNEGAPQQAKRDERSLHPSWEAKKKQKSASIVPSQGTKIVFSES